MLYFRTSSKIWSWPLTLTALIPFSLPCMGKNNSNNVFPLLHDPHLLEFLCVQHLTSEKVLEMRHLFLFLILLNHYSFLQEMHDQ